MKKEVSICWLRRDLRLDDNTALYYALKSEYPVLVVFIFDTHILGELPSKKDRRLTYIYKTLQEIDLQLHEYGSSLLTLAGTPIEAFRELIKNYTVKAVLANLDYEPYASDRDREILDFLKARGIPFDAFKDQVIFEKSEVVKSDGSPYTVFTPYSKAWKKKFWAQPPVSYPSEKHLSNLLKVQPLPFVTMKKLGFELTDIKVHSLEVDEKTICDYDKTRNIPAISGTSHAGVYLRFGTVSVRRLVNKGKNWSEAWLNELIWREFFMMILFHFPKVEHQPFKKKYEYIQWRNNEKEFEQWCKGCTGYPIVDAGMRELNQTGYMHNRVRMIVASFLTKLLLIDWRWGEAYFASKLLDYELSSNNGNWQWAAGCGCDAAPYFRIFNPYTQTKTFDPENLYIRKWVPEWQNVDYPEAIVDYKAARERALKVFGVAVNPMRNEL